MTADTAPALLATPRPVWLDRVRNELREPFAGGVVLAAAGGPALVGSSCVVPRCGRATAASGLCGCHHKRWTAAGRPDIAGWAASAPPRSKGVRPLRPCDVPGCRRGRINSGMCQTHVLCYVQAGRPDRAAWITTSSGPPLRPFPDCAVAGCGLEGEGRMGLCRSHMARWGRNGRLPLDEFLAECDTFGTDRFDLRHLPEAMRAEIAYGLQRRADEVATQTRPEDLRRLLTRLPGDARSLRERSSEQWIDLFGWHDRPSSARRFLTDTLGWLDDLDTGIGWDVEYDRDVWLLRRLGYPTRDAEIRFDPIAAEWLRQLAKRWARWRLSTGVAWVNVGVGVRAVTVLSESFPQLRRGPAALTRELLEHHLACLADRYPHPKTRTGYISPIAGLLRTARQHHWEPGLPAATDIYPEDYPRQPEPAPRAISEAVMAQLETPAALDGFVDPQARVIAEILIGTGLRVGDCCKLPVDCIATDNHGAAYLRYRNHKMSRDALVPIGDRLAVTIASQQQAARARFPDGVHLLVREKRNPDGRLAYSTDTFRHRLTAWLVDLEVTDELGRPVHITPHQWRHTYATRLINGDVPQEVVRRLLDHTTHHMTARYARLSQQTIRAKWEAARKVDIRGLEVSPPEGSLADAEWMKNNLARAKMALPNGYCTLPLQQRCEFANA